MNTSVAAMHDGFNLTGIVTKTNLSNQGAPWAAHVSRNGTSMAWNSAMGEVWVWTKN